LLWRGVNDGRTGVVVKYFIVALRDYAANQTKKTLAPPEFADDVEGLTA
jgi:hypothetical protein